MKWAKKAWKYSNYGVTHKKSETQNQAVVFICILDDLASLLRVQTGLLHNRLVSYES